MNKAQACCDRLCPVPHWSHDLQMHWLTEGGKKDEKSENTNRRPKGACSVYSYQISHRVNHTHYSVPTTLVSKAHLIVVKLAYMCGKIRKTAEEWDHSQIRRQ